MAEADVANVVNVLPCLTAKSLRCGILGRLRLQQFADFPAQDLAGLVPNTRILIVLATVIGTFEIGH